MDWKKALLLAGGAAGTCALVYYLRRAAQQAPTSATTRGSGGEKKYTRVEEITKEQVQDILLEIINSQDRMRGYMKELSKELQAKSLSFMDTYERVRKVQPRDPLEECGLSIRDFDQLLDRYQRDPGVRESIAKIMGAPDPASVTSERVQTITVKKIIDVHSFMLKELNSLVGSIQTLPNRENLDMKTVTIAAQAIVGAKVESTFGTTSEDIESAVLVHHTTLAADQEFRDLNIKIQETMTKLMGSSFGER